MSTSETMKITNNNNNQSNPQPFMSLESRIKMFERAKSTQINLNSQKINKPQIVPPQNSIKFQKQCFEMLEDADRKLKKTLHKS